MSGRELKGLASVVDLRQREKERLLGALSGKRALAQRYRQNLERLQVLYESAGAGGEPGVQLSVLAQNCGDYKQAVMRMVDSHRDELVLHEADMQVAQQALTLAVHKHEALDQVLERQRQTIRRGLATSEQKRQDEVATQTWLRHRS
jgi:flagellar export protein FliJ